MQIVSSASMCSQFSIHRMNDGFEFSAIFATTARLLPKTKLGSFRGIPGIGCLMLVSAAPGFPPIRYSLQPL